MSNTPTATGARCVSSTRPAAWRAPTRSGPSWRRSPSRATSAALVGEPVQGEGGFINPPPGYWEKIRKICDDNGVVFIDDEVQTGFGRTGKMFAIEHWKCDPDMIVIGQGPVPRHAPGRRDRDGGDHVSSRRRRASEAPSVATPCAAQARSSRSSSPRRLLPNTKMINRVETKRLERVEGAVRGRRGRPRHSVR